MNNGLTFNNQQMGDDMSNRWLVDKLVKWVLQANAAIRDAGGSPELIQVFPQELIETLARNNLMLVYIKDTESDTM